MVCRKEDIEKKNHAILNQFMFSKELRNGVNYFLIHFTSGVSLKYPVKFVHPPSQVHIDYLCSIRTNFIQSSNSAIEKANYFIEIVISNTP